MRPRWTHFRARIDRAIDAMQSTTLLRPRSKDRVFARPLRALLGLSVLTLAACQSGPAVVNTRGRTTDTVGEIELVTNGIRFALVSEAMIEQMGIPGETPDERTANFYSTKRAEAGTKVARNDAIAGLAQLYDQNGFAEWSTPGAHAGGAATYLNVTVDGVTRSMAQPRGANADPKQVKTFNGVFMDATLAIYNNIRGRQNVDGVTKFKKPELSERLLKEAGGGVGLRGGGN